MRSSLTTWYKTTESLLDYCKPLLEYGDAEDSEQLVLYVLFRPSCPLRYLTRNTISLRGMNAAVHFLKERVVHDDPNSVALAAECSHQLGKLHYRLLDVSQPILWIVGDSLLFAQKEQRAKNLNDQSWSKRLEVMECKWYF